MNRTEVINAINDPSLVHFSCCNPKVWYKGSSNEFGVDSICKRFHNNFYYYANMSNYYQDIYNHYLKWKVSHQIYLLKGYNIQLFRTSDKYQMNI